MNHLIAKVLSFIGALLVIAAFIFAVVWLGVVYQAAWAIELSKRLGLIQFDAWISVITGASGIIVALISKYASGLDNPRQFEINQLDRQIVTLRDNEEVRLYEKPMLLSDHGEAIAFDQLSSIVRCSIVGSPGTGKSLLLQALFLKLAEQCRDEPQIGKVPLPYLLHFTNWRPNQSFEKFLAVNWPYAGNPLKILAIRPVLILIDGFDEIPTKYRSQKLEQLRNWIKNRGGSQRIYITCRSDAYISELDTSFVKVSLPDLFTDEQVTNLAKKYLSSDADNFLGVVKTKTPDWAWGAASLFHPGDPSFLISAIQYYRRSNHKQLLRNPGIQANLYLCSMWNRQKVNNASRWLPFELIMSGYAQALSHSNIDIRVRGESNINTVVDGLATGFSRYYVLRYSKFQRRLFTVYKFFLATLILLISIPFILIYQLFVALVLMGRAALQGKNAFIDTARELVSLFKLFKIEKLKETFGELLQQLGKATEWSYEVPFGFERSYLKWKARRCVELMARVGLLKLQSKEVTFPNHRFFDLGRAHQNLMTNQLIPEDIHYEAYWEQIDGTEQRMIIMQAGLIQNPQEFVRKINEVDPLLAAKCILSGVDLGSDIHILVTQGLLRLINLAKSNGEQRATECAHALQIIAGPSTIEDIMLLLDSNVLNYFSNEMTDLIVDFGQSAVLTLLKFLNPNNRNTFNVAVRALGRINDKRAIKPLSELLNGSLRDEQILWVRSALAHLGDAESMTVMLRELTERPRSENFATHGLHSDKAPWSAYIYTSPNHEQTLKEFIKIIQQNNLNDSSKNCALDSLWITVGKWKLLQINPISILSDAYRTADDDLKICIASIFRELPDSSVLDLLYKDIKSTNSYLCMNVIAAIGGIRPQEHRYIDEIIGHLQDENIHIRLAAVDALGQIANARAVMPLTKLISDTTKIQGRSFNEWVAKALIAIGTLDARDCAADLYIEQMKAAEFDSGDWHVADAILSEIGTPKAEAARDQQWQLFRESRLKVES